MAYKTNKYDPLVVSISQDDLRDCIRNLAPNLDEDYMNKIFTTISKPGYAQFPDCLDGRIDSIVKFMNYDLNEIIARCVNEIQAKYVNRYGSLPEPNKIHLNLINDNSYKLRAKAAMWYSEHYEEKSDNQIYKHEMHDAYKDAIESGEPFNITDFSNAMQKSFNYLRSVNKSVYVDNSKKRKSFITFKNVALKKN